MSPKISKELSSHRLEQAKENIEEAELLYNGKKYKGANNRAYSFFFPPEDLWLYYSFFLSIKEVLALEPIDLKRHKDVIGYFNKNYINKEIFPKYLGRKISDASSLREDSDYEDEFSVSQEDTEEQLELAKELVKLVEEYLNNN